MIEIKLKKGESIERAIKRLKRSGDAKFVLAKIRERRYYEKPSVKKRRKAKKAKFEQYLKSKQDKLWR